MPPLNKRRSTAALVLKFAQLRLSERERKRVAPHHHLSYLRPVFLFVFVNAFQEFCDVRMARFDSPELTWQMICGSNLFVEIHQQIAPTVLMSRRVRGQVW